MYTQVQCNIINASVFIGRVLFFISKIIIAFKTRLFFFLLSYLKKKNIGEIIWHEKRIDKIIQFVHVIIEKHDIYRLLLFRIMTFTKRNYEIGRREER
jgi:hypothetical protein